MNTKTVYLLLFVASVAAYGALTFFGPIVSNTYDLSEQQIRLLQLTIVLPVVIIWAAAFYGSYHVKGYAEKIIKSKDGQAFNLIGLGLIILVLGVVINTLVGAIRPYVVDDLALLKTMRISSNYISVITALTGFGLMYAGSRHLMRAARTKRVPAGTKAVAAVVVLGFVAAFAYLVFNNDYRNSTPDPRQYQSYWLSDPLLALTLVVPYAVLWLIGAQTALNILAYKKTVKGILYRRALSRLAWGLLGVIAFSVCLQLLGATGPSLANLGLKTLLVLIYGILLLYGVGYILIASGARKLKKIEEV